MEDNRDTAGPSEPKKRKTQDTRNVQKLTDAELLRILEESDSETELASEEDGVESSEESDGAEFVLDETVEMAVNPSDREMAEGVVTRDNAADTTVAWEREPVGMINCPFIKNEGLLIQPTENTPLDYFRLLLTDEFLLTVVEETNRNAIELFLSAGTKGQSRINCWKDVTVGELLVFLGVFLHMGNVKMRNLQDYWKKDALFNVKGIADSISRNRFLLILRALHFSENPKQGKPTPSDRLYKIRPVINFFNERMCQVYYPGRELSLDESMILWRGRLLFRQYIKNKKHKYGIKLYILTTPTGMVLKFAVYTGMLDDLGGRGHAQKIVLHLLDEKLNAGHHVYMDNYYNSFALAKLLLDKKTHCTGTLRANRKDTPKEIQEAKLRKGEAVARFAEGVMIGKWRDKREVCYISNAFTNEMVEVETKRKEKKSKPLAIVNYNKFMAGVDRHDQMLSYYLSERKTIRWYKKLFIHVVEMILTNAHALHNKYCGTKMPLQEFRLSIIRALLPRKQVERPVRNPQHVVVKRESNGKSKTPRKKCRSCASRGQRTDTIYECLDCPNKAGYCLNCCVIHHL
ncbi:piggyBac transposable element-derived protein 4-like [Schistocerca piceifrons]|nr:piggyBac transposable element-derived protein 4-like [Schistocerca piceifrons]XP_047103884.1 piggyBac transposable element-derived protein 4-like [Schistocerca piceifrons]XP_047104497.1 piggyBac transposable element-derived protein 4-like [Schistocerca piceifrons]XP_047115719.1 piggyBac transposable element-derived protein 4-like [Schistocerca piceifrons]XP_047116381.1 piggyBac transposable element-derived protein 4-like [Schistocerca piceifrons]